MNVIRKKCDICKHMYDLVPDEDETDYRYQLIPYGEASRMDICPTCNDKLNLFISNGDYCDTCKYALHGEEDEPCSTCRWLHTDHYSKKGSNR